MTELFYKSAFLKELESINFLDAAIQMKVSVADMEDFIKDMIKERLCFVPTTTESEIRAKALKYAQSRFRHTYETMVANKMENSINWADMLDLMVAEQLKEE